MVTHLRFWLAIASLSLVWIAGLSSVPPRDSLGIAPQDEGYYKPSVMKCKDGSKKFTREQLNDDFCDCQDGTDEPGTSACPDGKFYCQNAGHVPLTIFSSRVNDGICDCCDGSDEYDGKTNCPNTCWEAGKVARERLKKKIATYKDGVIMRKQEVEKAKQAFIKDEEELSKLKNEESILKGLVQKLKEHKERIEKVEEEERRKKEEEKRLKEAEKKAGEQDEASKDSPHDDELEGSHGKLSESLHQDASEDSHDNQIDWSPETEIPNNEKMEEQVVEDHEDTLVESETDDGVGGGEASPLKGEKHVPKNVDGIIGEVDMDDGTESNDAASAHEAEQELEGLANTEGLSREELGRLVASRWTGENAAKTTNEIDNTAKDGKHEAEQDTDNVKQEYDDGYSSEADEDKYKYDDDVTDDVSDDEYEEDHVRHDGSYDPVEDDKADFLDSTSNSQSWLGKIQQTVQNIFQTFNLFRKPVNISEAAHVRKEYEDSSSKLSKIQSRISRLTEKLKHDYGKEKDFYSFYDQCFESEQNKYVYKVCPFKQASQVEGHATTQLGHWDKFEDSYRVMLFSRGDRCWNGPDRSLKVKLRCGLKNELTDVDEPSRCEYVALLSTPLLCLEEKLKELQQRLEQMNSSQPSNHDEL